MALHVLAYKMKRVIRILCVCGLTIDQHEKHGGRRRLSALGERSGRRAEIGLWGQLFINPAATVVTTSFPVPSKTTCDRASWHNDSPHMPSGRPLRLGQV